MRSVKIVLEGEPIPWKRVGGKNHRYDEQKKEKEFIRLQMFDQLKRQDIRTLNFDPQGAIAVSLTFYLSPKGSFNSELYNAKLWGIVPANDKPDFDNLAKFYCDCANKLLWSDDKKINLARISKEYSENPRTEIMIMTKDNLNVPPSVEAVLKVFSPEKLRSFAKRVHELDYLDERSINDSLGESQSPFKERWLSWTAMHLVEFAKAHAEDLRKIMKYTEINEEIKEIVEI